ncbi:MAG: right-handed parallel beta-helix repeat-containing protein [Abditibacteriaceae bacterium]
MNDNQSIQRLVDETWKRGGGTVDIPAGIYQMCDALHLRDNVHIVGEAETILQKVPSVRSALTQVCGFGHYEFSVAEPEKFSVGMGVLISDDNAVGFYTTQARIVAQRGKYFYIDRPFAHDYNPLLGGCVTALHSLIDGHGVRNAAVENFVLDGNWPAETNNLNGCRGGGIFLLDAHDITLNNIEVHQFNGDAISFQQCTDITVSQCFVHHNSGGGLHPGSGSVRYFLQDNIIEDNGGCGIYYCLRTTHSLCEKNTISRNGLDGISVGERDTNHILRNNTITKNRDAGICLRAPTIQSSDRLWIEGNELRDNNAEGKSAEFFIAHDLHDISFVRNEISTHNGAAIKVEGNCSQLFIAENEINDHSQMPDDIVGDVSSATIFIPKEFPAVGPEAANVDSAQHLNMKLAAIKVLLSPPIDL